MPSIPSVHSILFLKMKGVGESLPELVLVAEGQGSAVLQGITGAVGISGPGSGDLRPLNPDFRVIPRKTALVSGMVEIRDLVNEFRRLTQDQEAVCKAFGNIKLFFILKQKKYI